MRQQELKNLLHELYSSQRAIEHARRTSQPTLPGVLTFTVGVLAFGLEALSSLDDFETSNEVVDVLLTEAVGHLVDMIKRRARRVSGS